MNAKAVLTLGVILVTLLACGTSAAPTTTPVSSAIATTVAGAPATATGPAPLPTTRSSQPAVAVTTLPRATATPAGPPPAGDLSDVQMATILTDSLSAYPWQMQFQATDTTVGQSITGTVSEETPMRLEFNLAEEVNSLPVMVDIIAITPTLYARVTGVPTDVLSTAGLQDNQWAVITPTQDVLGLGSLATIGANPTSLLVSIGFQGLLTPSATDQTPFKLSGSQQTDGIQTNLYESEITATDGTTTTFKVHVGSTDSRIYQMEAHGAVDALVTMTYDTSIAIRPPIP